LRERAPARVVVGPGQAAEEVRGQRRLAHHAPVHPGEERLACGLGIRDDVHRLAPWHAHRQPRARPGHATARPQGLDGLDQRGDGGVEVGLAVVDDEPALGRGLGERAVALAQAHHQTLAR
jgi:hypothetical protein